MVFMKRNALIRILCAVLCAATLLGTMSLSVSAYPATAGSPASVKKAESAPGAIRTASDWVFSTFGFIGFIFDPHQSTIINQKPVFQWALGFNNLYDVFPWVVNVWTDTIKCEFNHKGKDWRIQLWKGGYGVFLATGGEIGIYTKPESMPIGHYNAPVSQDDWMYLRYTIYNKGKELFTRPSPYLTNDKGPYWWAPGYRVLSICSDFLSSPRKNVVMDATIQFHDAEMAQKFIRELEKKGFKALAKDAAMGLDTPERYQLADSKSVRLVWKNINEGIY